MEEEANECALKIQALWKGYRTRKSLAIAREVNRREAAALKIQKHVWYRLRKEAERNSFVIVRQEYLVASILRPHI